MMEHLTEVTQSLPSVKRERKVRRTWLGVTLVALGGLVSVGSFVLAVLIVQQGGAIDKWSVTLACLPFVGGLFLAVMGAHVASGELVSAALKDVGAMLRIWRRNGS